MISDPHKTLTLNIQNQKIPVWTYGNPKNTPIFFIHGYFRSFSKYIGDLPVRYLMKKYFVVCFDLPGFGYSKDISLDNLSFISEIQSKTVGKNKVILFGVSYGGLLSLEYAYKYPDKVKAIIIAGTPVFYNFFSLLKLARFLPKYEGKKLTKEIFNEFAFLSKNNLSKIKTPVLLYYNKSDYVANVFMGKKLKSFLPNSEIYLSNKQNHKWLLHRIDRSGLLDKINSFLDSL